MIIKEFLPNPIGNDKESEYIKLFNDGRDAISLIGWKIKDASGADFNLSGSLNAGQELVLPYSQTKISLNNNGEKIFLYDASGKLIDELSYSGQAKEGEIIAKSGKGIAKSEKNFYSETANNTKFLNLSISNYQGNFLFLDFLTAAILAGLSLYIILQLEKELEIKLF